MNGRSGMKPREDLAFSGSRARSWPLMTTRPDVGFRRPAMMRMLVVLPAPLGPRNPWISPGATSRLTPSTAVNEPYFLTRPSTWIMGSGRGLRPAPAARLAAREVDLGRAQVLGGPAHEHGRETRPDVEVHDPHARLADGGEDHRLLVQAAASDPHVGDVGGELV